MKHGFWLRVGVLLGREKPKTLLDAHTYVYADTCMCASTCMYAHTRMSAHTVMYTSVQIIERMTAQSAAGVNVCARRHTCFRRRPHVSSYIRVSLRLILLRAHTRDSACTCVHAHIGMYAHTVMYRDLYISVCLTAHVYFLTYACRPLP